MKSSRYQRSSPIRSQPGRPATGNPAAEGTGLGEAACHSEWITSKSGGVLAGTCRTVRIEITVRVLLAARGRVAQNAHRPSASACRLVSSRESRRVLPERRPRRSEGDKPAPKSHQAV